MLHDDYRRGQLIPKLAFSARIDAINFLAPKAPNLSGRHFTHAFGRDGFALHDPDRDELGHPEVRDCLLVRAEIAIDVGPSKATMRKIANDPALWAALMRQTHTLLWENHYPWRAPGITAGAVRSVGADKKAMRHNGSRPTPGRTIYFGHRDDPAYLSVYHKVRDQGVDIPRLRECIRVELVLNADGCARLGLRTVGDILDFNYRSALAPYFHFIRPRARPTRLPRVKGRLRCLLEDRLTHIRRDAVREAHELAGSHVLIGLDVADTGKNAAYAPLNRAMRHALDNILRRKHADKFLRKMSLSIKADSVTV